MQAMLIPPMQLTAPDGVRVYPKGPTVEDEKSVNGVFTQGVRTEKASYVFTKAGDYVLPQIEITWWDLTTKKLTSSKLPATKIHVTDTSAYVSELPPEQETPTPSPMSHRNWRYYFPIAATSCIVLLILAILAWAVSRWGSKLSFHYRAFISNRRESEPAHWRRFKQACVRNDASQSYALLLVWLRRANLAMTLDEFQQRSADPRLNQEISILSSTLFGAEGKGNAAWNGRDLYAAVARHRRNSVSTEAVLTHLPPLNPR
jgi:hypothetical protein